MRETGVQFPVGEDFLKKVFHFISFFSVRHRDVGKKTCTNHYTITDMTETNSSNDSPSRIKFCHRPNILNSSKRIQTWVTLRQRIMPKARSRLVQIFSFASKGKTPTLTDIINSSKRIIFDRWVEKSSLNTYCLFLRSRYEEILCWSFDNNFRIGINQKLAQN